GTTNAPAWLVNTYDQQTRRRTEAQLVTGTGGTTIDDTHYSYDNAGNILSQRDTSPGGPTDMQCFRYDYLARLSQAWAQGSPGGAASPSQSAEGGPAPYWNAYTYDVAGNLPVQVATPPTGGATTATDTYPAADAARPHAVQTQRVAGPAGT